MTVESQRISLTQFLCHCSMSVRQLAMGEMNVGRVIYTPYI